MSKERYEQWGYESFKDTKTGEISDNHIHLLNQQDQRIAELEEQLNSAQVGEQFALKCCKEAEEQLKNAIVPKFKPHNDLFVIIDYINGRKIIEQYYIDEIVIRDNGEYIEYRDIERQTSIGENNLLFATKEEAQAKLEELKGE